MDIPVTRAAARTVETPAATMLTYISPTTPVSTGLAVWRTDMAPGAAGPRHTVDTDHVVVVLAGSMEVEVGGEEAVAVAGDCVVLPAGALRRITAGDEGVTTLTSALPGSRARVAEAEPVVVPWAN